MKVISDLLQRNGKYKPIIHVIGDSMVDDFHQARVTRISPESPNVCVMVSDTDQPVALPGGAANVCYSLRNFNVDVRLFCWADDYSEAVYDKAGLWCGGLVKINGLIPRKKRFFDGDVQVSDRWDIERPFCGLNEQEIISARSELIGKIHQAGPVDVVIFSDYNKGLFSLNPFSYLDSTVPVTIVDPKKGPLDKWYGCTIFKPNAVEAQELSGLTDWKDQCIYFKNRLNCKAVIITQSGNGVVGLDDEFFEYRPKNKVNAVKIMGAGDCFVGILALAVGHGFNIEDAAIMAFEAGLLYVQNSSHMPIVPWQLHKQSKFVNPEELCNRNFKLVLTNGCFDILHAGHLESLRIAKNKGDKLVVAVNSDASVSRLKGPKRPVISLKDRMDLLAALEMVDYVVYFDEDCPQKLIEQIKPDVLVKGEDWKGKKVAGADIVKEICYVPLVNGRSTTSIIDKICSHK